MYAFNYKASSFWMSVKDFCYSACNCRYWFNATSFKFCSAFLSYFFLGCYTTAFEAKNYAYKHNFVIIIMWIHCILLCSCIVSHKPRRVVESASGRASDYQNLTNCNHKDPPLRSMYQMLFFRVQEKEKKERRIYIIWSI